MEDSQSSSTKKAEALAEIRAMLLRLHREYSLSPAGLTEGGTEVPARGSRRFVERATRPFLSAQVRFNATLLQLLELTLSQSGAELESNEEFQRAAHEHLGALRTDVDRLGPLEEHLRSLDQRTAAQEAVTARVDTAGQRSTRELERRVSALERELSSGHARVEVLLARLQEVVAREEQREGSNSGAAAEIGQMRAATRGVAGLSFEDLHRGERAEIMERQRVYLPYFAAAKADAPLLDIGCGRGEFLELARESGIAAEGLDHDPEMVADCRARGLVVHEGDAIAHLRSLADGSLGGIIMSQVIEHLTLDQMTELVALGASKLRPGTVFAAETVNPECLSTFAGAFYLDLTHIRPIHPEAARFLWRWAGLGQVEILRLSLHDESERLEQIRDEQEEWAGVVNRNAAKLDRLLFGYRDYAVVGYK